MPLGYGEPYVAGDLQRVEWASVDDLQRLRSSGDHDHYILTPRFFACSLTVLDPTLLRLREVCVKI
jgi:hypothetical protein